MQIKGNIWRPLAACVVLLSWSPGLSAVSPVASFLAVRDAASHVAHSAVPAALSSAGQPTVSDAMKDLSSPDAAVRLRTVQALKATADLEAALPLAKLLADPNDDVQLEAVAAELNIFLADPIVPRKRVGLVVEVRNRIEAEAAFAAGPLVIGPRPVPIEVLTALRADARDDDPRVAVESLYAFGALAIQPQGAARRDLLRTIGPDLAAITGAAWRPLGLAAIRVIGRVFERRTGDEPIDPLLGDAVIAALNDKDGAIRAAAIQALGAIRYESAVQALSDLMTYFRKGAWTEAAFDGLAHIAHPSSAPLFASALGSKSPAMRAIAVEGIARLGDTDKFAEVQSALAVERNDVVLLAGAFASAKLQAGPIDPLVDALRRPKLRDQAREYLAELATGHSAMFERALQDADTRIRLDVVDALGLAGDATALPLVEPLAQAPDLQVARAAERAAARLRAARDAVR